MDSNTVAIIPCRDYAPRHVDAALGELFSHVGGPHTIIKPGQRVLIKPNLVAAFKAEKAETTHPSLIEGLIKIIQGSNAYPFIGDGPAFGSAHGVARACGIRAVARRYAVPIVKFKANKDIYRTRVPERYVLDQLPLPIQKKVRQLSTITKSVYDFDVIINVPKLKAHVQTVFTGAVKNVYGFIQGKAKALRHFFVHDDIELFSLALLHMYERTRPDFTVVDGITVIERRGLYEKEVNQRGFICGGRDCIHIDSVITYLVGKTIHDIPHLACAYKYKMPGTQLDLINIVGDTGFRMEDYKLPLQLESIEFSVPRIVRSVITQALLLLKEKGKQHTA